MLDAASEDHDQVDPAESLMREVGAQLRQVRLERGEDLDDVAQYLRIKSTYLFGIEQGDLSVMPGRTYALGFLRSYADYLGFDGEDLITRIKSTVEDLTDRTRLRIRTPLPENRLPKTPIVVMSLAIVAGIYAGWSYLNRSSRMVVDTVAEVPGNLRDLAGEVMPRDVPQDGPVPAEEGTDAERAAAPEASSSTSAADPSDARAATEALPSPETGSAAANASSTTDPEPRGSMADPARGQAAPLAADQPAAEEPVPTPPQAAPEQSAAPQAGPPAETVGELAEDGERGALTVQPAAGREPIARGAAPRGTRPDVEAAGAAPNASPSSGAAAIERGDIAVGGTAPGRGEDVNAARDALARLDLSTGSAGAPQIYETVNADARVILRARGRTWIRVSSPSGNYLRSRTLEPGETFLVPNRPDLELWTGNAGGLEIIVDGASLAPLGEEGAVVRSVSLDPERLLGAADEQP